MGTKGTEPKPEFVTTTVQVEELGRAILRLEETGAIIMAVGPKSYHAIDTPAGEMIRASQYTIFFWKALEPNPVQADPQSRPEPRPDDQTPFASCG